MTWTALKAVMQTDKVQEICDKIKLEKDPEEIALLKRKLPIITPYAQRFTDNHRHAETAVSSGLTMLDIDHIDNPKEFFQGLRADALEQQKVALVHITASGHGLRIIAERRLQDIALDMKRLAAALGIHSYDACTKDLARSSFVVAWGYVLYSNPALLEFPDQAAADHAADLSSYEDSRDSPELKSDTQQPTSSILNHTLKGFPESFHGAPYSEIVRQLIILLGGTPDMGERNTFYFTLVRYMRYICDFNQAFLLQLLPDFGLSLSERQSVVASAVNRPRKSESPSLINRAVVLATPAKESSADNDSLLPALPMPELPANLPEPLATICNHLPPSFRPSMVIAALPVLGTLATRVRFRYIDFETHSFSFMSCISAPAATGKSFIRKPVSLLMTPIDRQDEVERQKEQEYKDALKASKNSKNQPENPHACPRNNGINMSIAKLLQLLTYSNGKHLIGIGEEIDTLVKTERAGVWSQKSDIYRLGFDNAKYGQCYMSDNSFSANVPVYYNLLLTGTPGGVFRFFKDVEDGLVTRFCFAQLPDMFNCDIPVRTPYTEEEEDLVRTYAEYLDKADGELSCPLVDEAIRLWLKEKQKLVADTDSHAIDRLRRRAAVIGFRAGYLCHLLNLAHETLDPKAKSSILNHTSANAAEFARWIADFTLVNQMQLFGQAFEQADDDYESAKVKRAGKVQRLLSQMRPTFDKSDLMALRARNGQSTNVETILTRWKQAGLIQQLTTNSFRKL